MGLFGAAATGDPVARQVIDELLDHVGMALVAVGAIVDPALVILDGPVGRALEPYVPTWRQRSIGGCHELRGSSSRASGVTRPCWVPWPRRSSSPGGARHRPPCSGTFSISGGAHGMS